MNKEKILALMARADRMRNPIRKYLNTVVCLFDRPTPALWSFQAAAMRLGCQVLTLSEDQSQSAHAYGDMVVMNPDTTQNRESDLLAELYALYKELNMRCIDLDSTQREPLHVTILGDGPTVQPFVYLLQRFPKLEFHYVSDEIEAEVMEETDVFYVAQESFPLDKEFLNKTKYTSIVMRTQPYEENTEIWHNPRCIYSTQDAHGVYMRMALLDQTLSTLSWPSVYEIGWIFVDHLSRLVDSYISNGWSILTGSALVRTGV